MIPVCRLSLFYNSLVFGFNLFDKGLCRLSESWIILSSFLRGCSFLWKGKNKLVQVCA